MWSGSLTLMNECTVKCTQVFATQKDENMKSVCEENADKIVKMSRH